MAVTPAIPGRALRVNPESRGTTRLLDSGFARARARAPGNDDHAVDDLAQGHRAPPFRNEMVYDGLVTRRVRARFPPAPPLASVFRRAPFFLFSRPGKVFFSPLSPRHSQTVVQGAEALQA